MRRVLAATPAKLAEFKTASRFLLVLGRRIVSLFAIRALQRHNFPHENSKFVIRDL